MMQLIVIESTPYNQKGFIEFLYIVVHDIMFLSICMIVVEALYLL